MDDIQARVYTTVVTLWRRRWIMIGLAWLICLLGWAYVSMMPNRYEVVARIYVDTDSLLSPLLKGISVDVNMNQQVEFMRQTLLSRPNLERVLQIADLEREMEDPAERDRFVRRLRKRIDVLPEGQNLFSVTYGHSNPERANTIVKSLLAVFVETHLGSHRLDMEQARRFIDGQLQQSERELRIVEERLATFKQRHMAELPEKGNHGAQLEAARLQSRQFTSELADARTRREILRRQIAVTPPYVEGPAPVAIVGRPSELELRIVELQKSLDLMRSQYTDSHPDVVAAQRSLKLLREEYEKEIRNPSPRESAAKTVKQYVRNPLHDQYNLRFIEVESEVRQLERRLSDQQAEVDRLEKMASSVPQIETEFKTLDRDYQAIKKNNEELLARREQARLSQEVAEKAERTKYRLVDPPKLPEVPSGPNRPLLMTLVLVVALGTSGLFAYGLGQLDDSFSTTQQLKQAMAYPVIGGISLLLSTAQARRRMVANTCFTALVAFLFISYGGMLVLVTSVGAFS